MFLPPSSFHPLECCQTLWCAASLLFDLEMSRYGYVKIIKFSWAALSALLQLFRSFFCFVITQETLHEPALVFEDVGLWMSNTATLESAI